MSEVNGTQFRLRDVLEADAASLVNLARANLRVEWTEDFVYWKYFRNPSGKAFGCCAELDGKLVGFYANMPVRIKVGDRVVAGAQAVDAMVALAVRRQGLFSKLGSRSSAGAAQEGVRLSYAVANPISRAGAVKRLAFADVGEVPRFVRVLDPGGVVRIAGLMGARALAYRLALRIAQLVSGPLKPASEIRVSRVSSIDGRFDVLWRAVATEFPVAVVRDSDYLTWRYVDNPLVQYTILIAERGGDLLGYAILSHRDLEQGIVAIAELIVSPGDRFAGVALLAKAVARAEELGAAQMQCWMLPRYTFYTELLRTSGFIFSDGALVPRLFGYTSSLIAKSVDGHRLSPDPLQLRNWYLTMGDQDYY